MVHTKQEIIEFIQTNKATLKEFGLENIGLFGSFVRDEAQKNSDVDLLISLKKEKKTLTTISNLAYYLEKSFNRKVELITPESLNTRFGKYIFNSVEYISLT